MTELPLVLCFDLTK